jgi:hypothetical protein
VYFLALAADYEGILANDGVVADQTIAALKEFKESGRRLILVTGRELPDLKKVFPELGTFEVRHHALPVTAGDRQCSAAKDVTKFAAPARRKIAPPLQRPLWRQLLCGLETRALALQRD